MTIKDTFTSDQFRDEFKVVPVNVKDAKGKDTIAQGTPDLVAVLLGMPAEATTMRIISGANNGQVISAPVLKDFYEAINPILNSYIEAYVTTAQKVVGTELGVDMDALQESGADGFQIDQDDPRITQPMIDKILEELDKVYPTGPLTANIIQAVINVADDKLGSIYEDGADNWKIFIGLTIINTINSFTRSATTIVNQQIIGPLVEVVQYKQYVAQQQAAMKKAQQGSRRRSGLVDLAGGELSSEKINELTLPPDAKKDKIVN